MISILRKNWMIFVVLSGAFLLRFINLGYSDYQGDEIRALFLPNSDQSVFSYLLDQRKGPLQFLVTAFLKIFNPLYDNEFLLRLPFAFAGYLSVFFFYKLTERLFNKSTAFVAAFLMATNGFFIAFSRIVQYQSLVILFMILALFFFVLAIEETKWKVKGIYLGFICWALSILSHYDGIFIAPMAGVLLIIWYLKNKELLKHLLFSLMLPALLLSAFYIPFVLEIKDSTLSYWKGRISGTGGKISSSVYLFQVYHPFLVKYFYSTFLVLGTASSFVMVLKKQKAFVTLGLVMWVLAPVVFMEVLVDIPGTHIYTYLAPMFILMGLGISKLFGFLKKTPVLLSSLLQGFVTLVLLSIFSFSVYQSYIVFVEHSREYPWDPEKRIFGNKVPQPSHNKYHLSLFGFPYNRNWEEIGDLVSDYSQADIYYTNEKVSISGFYVPLKRSSNNTDVIVQVEKPQSFVRKVSNEGMKNFVDANQPAKIFYSEDGRELSRVYFVPKGSIINSEQNEEEVIDVEE